MNVDILKENVIALAKFRTSNHKLPIETGRWSNIPRNQRICHLCETEIGDEYHYIMKCAFLTTVVNYMSHPFIQYVQIH